MFTPWCLVVPLLPHVGKASTCRKPGSMWRLFMVDVCTHTLEWPRREAASRDSSSDAASSAVHRSRRYRAVTLASSRAASAASPAARYSRA
jgi:hypothetical protein